MTITYTWLIPQLDCAPSEDGLTNVVKTVHWRVYGEDDGFKGFAVGTTNFPPPEASNFIPYESLTQQIVVQWLETTLDATNTWEPIETGIKAQISNQKNPPIVSPPVPWG